MFGLNKLEKIYKEQNDEESEKNNQYEGNYGESLMSDTDD
jgi:hypothetical protein